MLFLRLLVLYAPILIVSPQVTKVIKRNHPLLSRKKRYLAFPMNSNFVITLSFVKPLMVVQPRGFITLGECDVPFPLPSDTRLHKNKMRRRNHYIHRRELLTKLEESFAENGLNGAACIRRIICEARQYVDAGGKSLVRDLISAIFKSAEIDLESPNPDSCHNNTFLDCEIPFLRYILASIFPA